MCHSVSRSRCTPEQCRPAIAGSKARRLAVPPRTWRTAVAHVSRFQLTGVATALKHSIAQRPHPTFGGLKFDDSALEPDGDGVRAVVRSQLLENVADVAFYGILSNRKLGGDLLVRVPLRDQFQNLQFARGQLVLGGMHGQLGRDLRRNPFLPSMYSAYSLQQIRMYVPLQQITARASFERAHHLDVASVRSENDYPGIGEFTADGDDRFDPAGVWHLQIHEGDVRLVPPELLDPLPSRRSLRDHLHVRFELNQRCDARAQKRMVVDREDSDRLRFSVHGSTAFSVGTKTRRRWSLRTRLRPAWSAPLRCRPPLRSRTPACRRIDSHVPASPAAPSVRCARRP